jgi:hypothetical protein
MPLPHHRLEEDEEVQVGAGEVNFLQHVAEFVSLDAA